MFTKAATVTYPEPDESISHRHTFCQRLTLILSNSEDMVSAFLDHTLELKLVYTSMELYFLNKTQTSSHK